MCPCDGRQFVWSILSKNAVFSNVDGKSDNRTAKPVAIKDGQRYTLLIQVRRDDVRAFLDNVFISRAEVDSLSLNPDFALRRDDTVGLSVWNSHRFSIDSAKIVEITGTGKKLYAEPSTLPAIGASPSR